MFKRFVLLMATCLLVVWQVGCDRGNGSGEESWFADDEEDQFIGGIVKVVAVRVAATAGRTAEEIAPYDEALAWHEYEVKDVLGGELKDEPERIRVAHWTVARGKTVKQDMGLGHEVELTIKPFEKHTSRLQDVAMDDDLDVVADEPPLYLDLKVVTEDGLSPEALRFDYGGFVSGQMQLYWKLRSQLELVVLGNSHASRAILAKEILGEENRKFPKALNLGTGGADGYLQCLIADKYVKPLPKLKTVIWMVSPRTFNQALGTNHRYEIFDRSPGSEYDRQHEKELWPAPDHEPLVATAELEALKLMGVDSWGWTGSDRLRKLQGSKQEQEEELRESMSKINFEFDEDLWDRFIETVYKFTERNIKVFLVISPIHPLSRETPAADPDGSSPKALRQLVERLHALGHQQPLIWFHDTNRNGNHQFKDEEFYDADHLNKVGAGRFTAWVKQWMERVNQLQEQQ